MSGHTLASFRTLAGADDGIKLIEGHTVPTHLYQCAHHSTHHITQEAVGSNHEAPGGPLVMGDGCQVMGDGC